MRAQQSVAERDKLRKTESPLQVKAKPDHDKKEEAAKEPPKPDKTGSKQDDAAEVRFCLQSVYSQRGENDVKECTLSGQSSAFR